MEFQTRFLRLPTQSFFLFGPRGTGKSTWLRHQFPDALVVDLLRPDIYREMQTRPERLRQRVLGAPRQATAEGVAPGCTRAAPEAGDTPTSIRPGSAGWHG